jgi:hypothetical protein
VTGARRVLLACTIVTAVLATLGFLAVAFAGAAEPETFQPPGAPLEPVFEPAAVCPGPPDAYHGESESVAAEYGNDLYLSEFCKALVAGVGRLRQTVYWGLVESLGTEQLQREGTGYLQQLAAAPPASAGGDGPLLESGFESNRFALWLIAAIGVALLPCYVLVRLVIFRDN